MGENINPTPEELKAEEEIQKGVNEDELRTKLAEDLGIDPDTESDLLNKIVEREKSHHEKLFGAIKQKITWREKAKSTPAKPESKTPVEKSKGQEIPDIDKLLDERLEAKLAERDLNALSLPDELKAEIKDLAKLKGISIREATQLPYIVSRKETFEREERIKSSIPSRSSKGGYSSNYDPSKPLNSADFNLQTEEGQKAWNDAKAARHKNDE